VLSLLVEAFEHKHQAISAPDPIAVIEHCMESRGLTRKDLELFIGSRARVSEVMSRKAPTDSGMIRRLAAGLRIPADLLIQPYPVTGKQTA
jgi:HTH-type transcriptional regulator/antitoxin HigA